MYLHCRNTPGGLFMQVRVQKWGNSLAVRIPKPLAKDAAVSEGTVLNLAVSDGRVIATPVETKNLSLRALLSKINKKNLHGEVDFGRPAGCEIW
jgi:antitoxin MazE